MAKKATPKLPVLAKPKKLSTQKAGYEESRFNATRHRILNKYTILPWEEDEEEINSNLFQSLIDEHKPKGPTELHFVEEIAGVMWRKRRLRRAEADCFLAQSHMLNKQRQKTSDGVRIDKFFECWVGISTSFP